MIFHLDEEHVPCPVEADFVRLVEKSLRRFTPISRVAGLAPPRDDFHLLVFQIEPPCHDFLTLRVFVSVEFHHRLAAGEALEVRSQQGVQLQPCLNDFIPGPAVWQRLQRTAISPICTSA